jgi:hypothetical protein
MHYNEKDLRDTEVFVLRADARSVRVDTEVATANESALA